MPELSFMGKLLILAGVILVLMGMAFLWGNKIPFLGKLPGDIYIHRGNFTFYFPLSTCIVISLILTLILTLFLGRR
ncbi:DUF2905 domain-containing protein [Candidatus Aerophobetes bacterium]|uniref:DUF2905 domain-containing protein n=1 Tax=Aerophobetes bacterium TaxID=2030807 RepID=A0A497E6J3_UNCAE|nr:DUF2905 domain-containing protein [Candidatus Aerophobetes bacterium]RLE09300.1 MAG: DUF2905 domain-containing protein [Candidatus Aerophobetes bacterium]